MTTREFDPANGSKSIMPAIRSSGTRSRAAQSTKPACSSRLWDLANTFFLGDRGHEKCHRRMFDYYGGVPHVTVPDCLKTDVLECHLYDPDLNEDYTYLAAHFSTAIVPARVRKPKVNRARRNRKRKCRQRIFDDSFDDRPPTATSAAAIPARAYMDGKALPPFLRRGSISKDKSNARILLNGAKVRRRGSRLELPAQSHLDDLSRRNRAEWKLLFCFVTTPDSGWTPLLACGRYQNQWF
jgi:hypothetical protein